MADIILDDVLTDALERNYAEDMSAEELDLLGNEIVAQVETDLASREQWEQQNDQWMALAAQFLEEKNWPWPNAANVKYPLLATASLQFHARAYPALVTEQSLVKVRKHGRPTEEKNARARRVQEHMSYQILEEMTEWQEDMDRLMYILPITGLAYKKVYYSPTLRRATAPIILAKDLIINYEATNFERAIKTHRVPMDANELREMQNLGAYLDCDLRDPEQIRKSQTHDQATGTKPSSRQAQDVYTLYECHGWWDFDGDGYKEPYIVTVDRDSKKVLQIISRWKEEDVSLDENGEILRIQAEEYFIPYRFLPNPESSIYALGFGSLLGPLNSAANTVINQLINAGTLATTQGGFLSKQIRARGGAMRFQPGEWKQLQVSGSDLSKGIFPMPVKEPSNVLFLLLGQLINSGERLSSVADIMVGENPGQNQPYSTTMAVLEQGLKVFTGIYKRVYRSLGAEFKRLYCLNQEYLDEETYYYLLDLDPEGEETNERTIQRLDYNSKDLDVIPGADPAITSDAQRIMRAQSLEAKIAAGFPLNVQEVTRISLEAEGHDNIEALMTIPEQGPPPDVALQMAQFEHQKMYEIAQLQLEATNKRFEAFKDLAQAIAHLSKAEANAQSVAQGEAQHLMDMITKEHGMLISEADMTAKLIQSMTNSEKSTGEAGESEATSGSTGSAAQAG